MKSFYDGIHRMKMNNQQK